jgi:hypothetical protein
LNDGAILKFDGDGFGGAFHEESGVVSWALVVLLVCC